MSRRLHHCQDQLRASFSAVASIAPGPVLPTSA
jgi:hypothetical protein